MAVALLAARGFSVAASTGKPDAADYLKNLGATSIIDRNTLSEAGKPLQAEQWAGVVDAVGGNTLANACAQTATVVSSRLWPCGKCGAPSDCHAVYPEWRRFGWR